MNKTIIININGFVFHIEEDAYEILKAYMTDVKRHFLNSADSHEITTDIENRIAEMFTDILARDNKQAIVEQDVNAIIEQMGKVEDFEHTGDANDTYNSNSGSRALFRDSDDHLLGGVCAGLANYFDTQAVWIRLAFFIAFMFFGSGLILYIVLWIVIPKATTRADRMAMKGQKLDLQGFKQNLEDEYASVRERLTGLGHDAKPLVYKTRDFFGDFFHHLGVFFSGAGRLLGKMLAVIVLMACFGMLITLIVTIIGFLAYGKMGLYHIFPFNVLQYQLNTVILIAAFLLLAVPLLVVIMVIMSAAFNTRGVSRAAGSAFLSVWIITLGIIVYYTAKVSADFRHEEKFSQTISINPTANNTYYLNLNDVKYLSAEDSVRLSLKEHFNNRVILDDDDNGDIETPNSVRIFIEKSDVVKPVLVESFSARGRNDADALANAQSTTYQFAQQDSVLKFNRRLEKPLNDLWRDQEIRLTLKMPLNAKVIIDRNLARYIDDLDIYQCNDINKQHDAPTTAFIMTADGLQCKVDTVVRGKPVVK